MIACVDHKGIQLVVDMLNKVYTKANVCDGKVIDYLGMIFDFSIDDEVTIGMEHMVHEILQEMDIVDGAVSKTPAASYLFDVDEKSELLNNNMRERFHSHVAKLLFMAKRARPDILTAVSYLTTRVQKSTISDWRKLVRVARYLNGTKSMNLTLKANPNEMILNEYVDVSFAIHPEARSHTGSCTVFDKGVFRAGSKKQTLVSKSSTEAELVGISDDLSPALGCKNLMENQGYKVKLLLHQDNKSAIMLAHKGRSTSNRTRHIAIRYYFVKDRIDKGDVEIVYTNTEEMLADYFTKPLQGELFVKLRDLIMGKG
jgi:hypothetical protein